MSRGQVSSPPTPLDPAVDVFSTTTRLYRVHEARFAATEFNPGLARAVQRTRVGDQFIAGRFSFFLDDEPIPAPVPVLYAADTENAAIWETILRDRAPQDDSWIAPEQYEPYILSCVSPTRELRIASFAGADMTRFKMQQQDLIDPGPDEYEHTIPWARAAWAAGFDGIKYVSKRDLSSLAYAFFEPRDKTPIFEAVPDAEHTPIEFGDHGEGFMALRR